MRSYHICSCCVTILTIELPQQIKSSTLLQYAANTLVFTITIVLRISQEHDITNFYPQHVKAYRKYHKILATAQQHAKNTHEQHRSFNGFHYKYHSHHYNQKYILIVSGVFLGQSLLVFHVPAIEDKKYQKILQY